MTQVRDRRLRAGETLFYEIEATDAGNRVDWAIRWNSQSIPAGTGHIEVDVSEAEMEAYAGLPDQLRDLAARMVQRSIDDFLDHEVMFLRDADHYGDIGRCPACGDPIDYCRGHGEIGDAPGRAILVAHDDGDHRFCHPDGCEEAKRRPARTCRLSTDIHWCATHHADWVEGEAWCRGDHSVDMSDRPLYAEPGSR